MKWSFATIGVILLGVIGVSIILLFQTITTNNENDYYLLKEVTEAAMIDAIDIPYYRETGDLKIVKEKFVENFTRRYSESTVFLSSNYTIKFFDIMETPPKVSIIIDTGIGEFTVGGNTDDYGIRNKLDAILEYTGKNTYATSGSSLYNNPYIEKENKDMVYYAMSTVSDNAFDIRYSVKIPDELVAPNIKNIKIKDVSYVGNVTSQSELGNALLMNEIAYNGISTDYNQFINEFSTDANGVVFKPYNCKENDNADYVCDDDNRYYIDIRGKASGNKTIFKYKVTWSYDEYEFS